MEKIVAILAGVILLGGLFLFGMQMVKNVKSNVEESSEVLGAREESIIENACKDWLESAQGKRLVKTFLDSKVQEVLKSLPKDFSRIFSYYTSSGEKYYIWDIAEGCKTSGSYSINDGGTSVELCQEGIFQLARDAAQNSGDDPEEFSYYASAEQFCFLVIKFSDICRLYYTTEEGVDICRDFLIQTVISEVTAAASAATDESEKIREERSRLYEFYNKDDNFWQEFLNDCLDPTKTSPCSLPQN